MDWVNWQEWDILFGLNWYSMFSIVYMYDEHNRLIVEILIIQRSIRKFKGLNATFYNK